MGETIALALAGGAGVTPTGIVVVVGGDIALLKIVVAVALAAAVVVVGDTVGSCVCAIVAKIPADCKFGSILSLESAAVVAVDTGVDMEGIAASWLVTIGVVSPADADDGSIVVELAPVRTVPTSLLVVGDVAVTVVVAESVGVVVAA